MEREAIHKTLLTTLSQEWIFNKGHKPPSNETREKKPMLPFINTIHSSSSKSQRNLNEEVVPNTTTAIGKPNFQGTAHNIIQKRGLT